MKKRQKMFLGFVIIVMAIFTMVGCDLPEDPEFPLEFRGTWIRENSVYTNTLTITATTYKLSHDKETWTLLSVSGDTYIIKSSPTNYNGKEVIRYVNGKLEIDPNVCKDVRQGNCGGTWIKK